MIRNFETIEDMIVYYTNFLHEWASSAENVTDDTLQILKSNLIEDYRMNLKLMQKEIDFDKGLYLKDSRMKHRLKNLDFKFTIKRLKATFWRQWLENRKLLKLFKKSLKTSSEKNIVEEEKKVDEFVNMVNKMKADLKVMQLESKGKQNLPVKTSAESSVDVNKQP